MATVREERPGDAEAIHAVHTASFPASAEADLVELLRSGGHLTLSLVAEEDDRIVGHVGFSPVTAAVSTPGVGLAPVAVLPSHRCRGIAAALVEAGFAEIAARGFGWVVVLGDPKYYTRFGFRPASEFGLHDEYGGGPAFQALELTEGALACADGLVRYVEEFTSLE